MLENFLTLSAFSLYSIIVHTYPVNPFGTSHSEPRGSSALLYNYLL